MKTYSSIFLMLFTVIVTSATYADSKNIVLYFKGTPEVNTAPNPNIAAFRKWCQGTCAPTTTFVLQNPKTNKIKGVAHVWGKDYIYSADGKSLCFTEFIEYDLKDGTIYTLGNTGGTCGAFIDANIIHPVSDPNAAVVAGGGDGKIVDGTKEYKNMKGTYTDRVFVEFLNNNINYYNGLYFTLMPQD